MYRSCIGQVADVYRSCIGDHARQASDGQGPSVARFRESGPSARILASGPFRALPLMRRSG